jgi:hypothetical protein
VGSCLPSGLLCHSSSIYHGTSSQALHPDPPFLLAVGMQTDWMLVTGKHPDTTILVGVGSAILTVAIAGAAQPNDAAAAAA